MSLLPLELTREFRIFGSRMGDRCDPDPVEGLVPAPHRSVPVALPRRRQPKPGR